jgi:aminoglycoside phosphotransferase (APT) family kinase protein
VEIDAALIGRLVAAQFPAWANLAVTPVPESGWDNRTFRLGERLLVRMPSAERYADQAVKEQTWLPKLAQHLPARIPIPVGLGAPGEDYPWPWSVLEWIEGEPANRAVIADEGALASDLAAFLAALQRIDASGGPPAGAHSFHRGGALSVYDSQTREALATLAGRLDEAALTAIWNQALASPWTGPPVWVHGDVAAANLIVRDGRLAAVIDFGQLSVGDPACDLAVAWSPLFGPEGRAAFRKALPLDEAAWARGRGWALWKALILFTGVAKGPRRDVERSEGVLATVMANPLGLP